MLPISEGHDQMKLPRVVHMTSVHPALDVRIFHRHCKSLARAGYEVVLIAPHLEDSVQDGVRIRALPKKRDRLKRMTMTVYRVLREAMRQKGDLFHFHDPELIPVGLMLAARGNRVLYDVHEDVPADILYKAYIPSYMRGPLGWFFDRFEKAASRRFAGIVCATSTIASRFARNNPNTVVVHNFPILEELPISSKPRISSIAYVGSITENRGIFELVKAVGLLPDAIDPSLVLAGSFSSDHLYQEASKLKGWRRVKYVGYVGRREITEILATSRLGVVTLRPEPNFIRSMPIKLFEYMAAGLPVVASDFPLWREIIEGAGCGLVVDPMDPEAIASAIEYLLTHPMLAEEMGRRGRATVQEKYNWSSEERELLGLYGRILNGVPATRTTGKQAPATALLR